MNGNVNSIDEFEDIEEEICEGWRKVKCSDCDVESNGMKKCR